MMTLADLQRDFSAFIRSGDRAVSDAVSKDAQRGLAVYHHAFRANLTDCLRSAFEKTHAWLGDAAFDAAAAAHIASHAPQSWTLAAYGEGFDRTLGGLYPADPEVTELAWLDWSLRRAFDGPDAPALVPATLAEVDWDNAALTLAPTLAARPISTNVAEIWNAMASGAAPPAARRLDPSAALIVWRRALSPQFKTVSMTELAALTLARVGKSFGEICGDIAPGFADEEATAAFAGAMLGSWIGDGVLVAVG